MGALAQTEQVTGERLAETQPSRPRPAPARRSRPAGRRQPAWNVLAEELVPFVPPARRRPVVFEPEEQSPRRPVPHGQRRQASAAPDQSREPQVSVGHRRVAARPRGLRRLLPGAATLAVLASVWVGAGALAGLHRPALSAPARAVKVPGGYLYVARPGDTLWSIASGLEPGGDPRPLVGAARTAAPRRPAGCGRRAQVALSPRAGDAGSRRCVRGALPARPGPVQTGAPGAGRSALRSRRALPVVWGDRGPGRGLSRGGTW